MTLTPAARHLRTEADRRRTSTLAAVLGLMMCAGSACHIADEDRCGEGYVYQKPGCLPLPDGATTDAVAGDAGGDSGEGSRTCMNISLCKQECADTACREGCATGGCQSAQEAAALLETCSQERCTSECADPSAAICIGCTQRECGPQLSTCLSDTCE